MNGRITKTQIPPEGDGITCDICWDRNHTPETCTRTDLIERMSRTVGSAQGTRQVRTYGSAPAKLASEKQIAFITRLVAERDTDSDLGAADDTLLDFGGGKDITSSEASALIDSLLRVPYKAREAAPAPQATGPVQGLDLSPLPSGHYAVPGGDTRLKVRIDKVEKGKWAGHTFVKDGAVYGQERRYGMQRPGQAYRGEIQEALAKIVADPQAAAQEYGRLTNQCAICNRPLEDEQSVERGSGSDLLGPHRLVSDCIPYRQYGSRRRGPSVRPMIGHAPAYRVLWERERGSLDSDLVLHHLCGNPWCVNLDHLEPMTQGEHMRLHGHLPPGGNRYNAAKDLCPAGHPYDEANTYINPITGWRKCRACHRDRERRRRSL